MGKTNSPLRFLVVGQELYDDPEVQELVEKGHDVTLLHEDEGEFDVIMGEPCWYMIHKLLPYLDIMMKDARRKRRVLHEKEGKPTAAKAKAKGKKPGRAGRPAGKVVPTEV